GAVSTDGSEFVFADGTPTKFWGVGSVYPGTAELAEQQARLYRIFGVNMVRLHSVQQHLGVLQQGDDGERVLDPEALDELDLWFAALKEAGVYFTFSSFYPHVVTEDDDIPDDVWEDLSEDGDGRSSSGFVPMVPELQDAEWAWMKVLLEHENPYTGMRYVDDPALAVLEVHNEDSIFWHAPLNTISEGYVPNLEARLQELWMEWLAERYASDEELAAAWGDGMNSDDSLSNPAMDIYGAWEMEADGPYWGEAAMTRMADFIQFLAELQRDYYEARYAQIRDLGFEGVVVSTAWKAGGEAADAANLWTDDAMDAIDRHAYFGGGDGTHTIVEGAVSNSSHLETPMSGVLGAARQQVEDKPFIVTEWTSSSPNQWKAEAAPLFAFYGMGLHGWDTSYHFTASKAWLRGG
ncbi:MAG: beta-galactosidase, partial [Myxococcota bacterium]|nr:beta-galactosidase [Myxococcota bacterium]